MILEVKSVGEEYFFEEENNIAEIFYTYSGLRIIIETQKSRFVPVLLEVFFRNVNGFRCLDEGDFIAYWESGKFQSSHHVYEIFSGGWSNGEIIESGILTISLSSGTREWFIKTTNDCITVLSGNEPILRELTRLPTQKDYA